MIQAMTASEHAILTACAAEMSPLLDAYRAIDGSARLRERTPAESVRLVVLRASLGAVAAETYRCLLSSQDAGIRQMAGEPSAAALADDDAATEEEIRQARIDYAHTVLRDCLERSAVRAQAAYDLAGAILSGRE